MIEPPQITDLARHHVTAIIHVRCTREEIQLVMGRGVRELLDAVQAQGAKPVAALYTHHLSRPTDRFDFEIGVPVNRPVEATGRVLPGVWPSMRVARTVHCGRYEDLPQSWGQFKQWIETQGLCITSELWECYVTGPERGSDARLWRTELIQPLQL
ncbi:GyrI-like domain-containing protein [Diaphorobacter sp. HDW4A]|uniref:GyrI-like domain-containing protein n=1 Tax=Diaphorobacter sp. HDW4A TaxID=2714924 RepID=UPI00140B6444|nr:GyrI-like domain-containing protein [Diaphorobacter sp. HDW4A]QIL83083.1 GyrI-like domain-containing protein [Diaphorobacter sp. HDW4A]